MTDLKTQFEAILQGAAFAPISDRAFLRVTRPDATRWLNGMVTNNIKGLAPGEGNYNFLLNAQGRILGDGMIYREPGEGDPVYLLETSVDQVEAVHQHLDKFIIMDDVELAKVDGLSGISVTGAQALSVVMALGTANDQAAPCAPAATAPQAVNLKQTIYGGSAVTLIQAQGAGVPRFEIWSDTQTIASIGAELSSTQAVLLSSDDVESFRVYAGVPRYGVDIRNTETAKDLPQETAQDHALSFNKGCYVGQEIVERIHSRGQVHRTFLKLSLEGALPEGLPAPLEANGKAVGEITSAVQVGEAIYALGYARREALDSGTELRYSGGIARPRSGK
jgi:folate-binding protein YgfZ